MLPFLLGWKDGLLTYLTKFNQLTSLNFTRSPVSMAAFSKEDSNPPPTLILNMDNLAGLDHLCRVAHCKTGSIEYIHSAREAAH
jgi:hypothetical protein